MSDTYKNEKYAFVKVPYESPNIIGAIKDNEHFKTELESFVKADKYWEASNTPTTTLSDLNVNVSNTKYLIPEFKLEISKNYLLTQTTFALLKFLYLKLKIDNEIVENDPSSEENSGNTSATDLAASDSEIYNSVEAISYLFSFYFWKSASLYSASDAAVLNGAIGYTNSFSSFVVSPSSISNLNKYYEYDVINNNTKKPVSLNQAAIENDFQENSNFGRDVEIVASILESLKYLAYINYINENSFSGDKGEAIKKLKGELFGQSSGQSAAILPIVFANVLSGVNQIISNSLNITSLNENGNNISGKTRSFIYKNLFQNIFISEGLNINNTALYDSLFLKPITILITGSNSDGYIKINKDSNLYVKAPMDDSAVEEQLLVYLEKNKSDSLELDDEYTSEQLGDLLVKAIEDLKEKKLNTTLDLIVSTSISENNFLDFLVKVIEHFVSYTSDVYKASVVREYNTQNEIIGSGDSIHFDFKMVLLDSVYYDDSLDITITANPT